MFPDNHVLNQAVFQALRAALLLSPEEASSHLFRAYSNPDLPGNRPGRIQLRDARQALDACNNVRAHLTSSYSILQQAYGRLNSTFSTIREGVVLQDVPNIEGWMKNIGDGIRQAETPFRVTIRTLETLVKKLEPML